MGISNKEAAGAAIGSIGLGYDLTKDLRLKYCKGKSPESRLIGIDDEQLRDISIPGGILIQNVSKSINCGKGERMRFCSDILDFLQMSEHFNHDVSLSGRIPTGQFDAAFEFTGSWAKDAVNTKALALDGVFITLYDITLEKSQIALCDHVKNAVPTSWEPAALAKFIQKFGTHVITGIKMGGKDVVYLKQQHSSNLPPHEVLKKLKDVAEKRFGGQPEDNARTSHDLNPIEGNDYGLINLDPATEDITVFWRRRGGSYSKNLDHRTWCQTIQVEPQVISMSFIPIASLLSGIDGNGFLAHALNLYMRYKPPVEELQHFLEFQLPTRWAPELVELPTHWKPHHSASLQFRFMGPKLYVNTNQVDVGNTPVTGLRLYLEGIKKDCLAIHLQHLSSIPKSFKLVTEPSPKLSSGPNSQDRRYHEKVQWKSFSHICTAPVESDDELSIVTGAEFEVSYSGLKRVLFLRLQFSKVVGATVVRQPEWDGSPVLVSQRSGIIATLISSGFSNAQKPPPQPADIIVNSALPVGPPVSTDGNGIKLLKFVDTAELVRGPQDLPGYWAVSGARLMVDKSKISLRAKFSLLAVDPADEETL